jgi:hypothetical protein
MSPEKQKITNLIKEVEREKSSEKRQMLIIEILKLINIIT